MSTSDPDCPRCDKRMVSNEPGRWLCPNGGCIQRITHTANTAVGSIVETYSFQCGVPEGRRFKVSVVWYRTTKQQALANKLLAKRPGVGVRP